MRPSDRTRVGSRAHLVVLAVVVAGATVWTLLPQDVPAMLVYEGIGYASALAVLAGVAWRRPPLRWPWIALALTIALTATGDLFYDLTEVVSGLPGYTSSLASGAYLVGYPFAIAAVIGLLGWSGSRRDLTVLIDGAVFGVATWLVIWVVSVQPELDTSAIAFSDWMPTVVYPPLDLVVLVACWRVGRGALRRNSAWRLVFVYGAVMLAADVGYAVLGMPTDGPWNRVLSVGFLLAYGAIGAAALHPQMGVVVADPEPVLTRVPQGARVAGLAVSVATPAVLLVGWPDEVMAQPVVVGVSAALLVAGGFGRALAVLGRVRHVEAALQWNATHDSLTGLPNRASLVDHLEGALSRARRHRSRCAVLFLDLDEFKVINDSLGHSVGDALLVAVADRLRGAIRATDTVARLGGDEFVVLCEDLADESSADAAAERVAVALHEPFQVAGTELHVNASIGMVVDAQLGSDGAETILGDADVAMYRAKADGRGQVRVFAPSMHEEIRERLRTENALRRAVRDGELRLAYQPIVHLADGRIRTWEALIRWDRPGVGIVAPDAFIPLAESSGLIITVGAWVMRNAVRALGPMLERDEDLRLAVNVSARELCHAEMAQGVIDITATESVNPSSILLEITETALLEPTETVEANLRALHAAGFGLAIDDFGTGYSSLASLKNLAVDTMKIDRAFTRGLGRNPDDAVLVRTIIEMAHSLGIAVTAEGIERTEQLDVLRALGCDAAQGYLLGAASFDLPQDRARRWAGTQPIAPTV